MTTFGISTRVLSGFDDPAFGPGEWGRLLATGQSDVVFLTWHWQSAWWEAFGRGQLLLIVAERAGDVVALAPLFAEAGMVYFVGSGGSDYLDFIGDTSDPAILVALLGEARLRAPGFCGFMLYHVRQDSQTGTRLARAGARLDLQILGDGDQQAPALELAARAEFALAATQKKSLVRHERYLRRAGSVTVQHVQTGREIVSHLDEFFDQHIRRWAVTPSPSLFCNPTHQHFYRLLTVAAATTGWLRFTRIEWQGSPVAFHFGFCYRGTFLWYKPSFAVEQASYSPGEVLLRQLLLAAIEEGAHTFDFGLGDEAFKARFATRVSQVRNWGLYEPTAVAGGQHPS